MHKQIFLLAWLLLLSGCASNPNSYSRPKPQKNLDAYTAKAVDTHIQLAVGYLQRGLVEVALEKIETALRFDNNSGDAHTVAGAINEQIGRHDQARYHYQRAIKLDPEDGGILNNYGQFLCKSGDIDAAEEHFQLAVKDPFYATPAAAIGNACSCLANFGQGARAEQYCRDAIDLDPRVPDPYYHLARGFYQQNQYMKARAFLQRYGSVGPDTAESLSLCVQIEAKLGARDLASSCRKRLLKYFPKSQQARQLVVEASR